MLATRTLHAVDDGEVVVATQVELVVELDRVRRGVDEAPRHGRRGGVAGDRPSEHGVDREELDAVVVTRHRVGIDDLDRDLRGRRLLRRVGLRIGDVGRRRGREVRASGRTLRHDPQHALRILEHLPVREHLQRVHRVRGHREVILRAVLEGTAADVVFRGREAVGDAGVGSECGGRQRDHASGRDVRTTARTRW